MQVEEEPDDVARTGGNRVLALALHAVGERYADGIGVARDMSEAAVWFERSAEAGFAPAQYRLGNMYEKGNGVERDYGLAMEYVSGITLERFVEQHAPGGTREGEALASAGVHPA